MEFKNITATERKCNRCGFATFSLRVLYQHKYKCQGKLLGSPQRCGYCKRKFIFPFLLMQHRKTCMKLIKKRKKTQHKLKTKTNKLPNGFSSKQPVKESKTSTIVCPICMEFFNSRSVYAAHEASGTCGPKPQVQPQAKKESASARKSIQKAPSKQKESKNSSESSGSDSSLVSDSLLSDIVEHNRKSARGYTCIRCKKNYPAKPILLKHLDSNYKCALAHFEQNYFKKKSAKARKSVCNVVARKSFSKSYHHKSYHSRTSSPGMGAASARKSLPNSLRKQQSKQSSVNQCPVCQERFVDSFTFYQHQKKYQHWGKATKTINLSCKCPFCYKEFFSVRARNAHIRNHADQSDQKIESFLKNTTCEICSQVFVSEVLKLQHLQIEHSKKQSSMVISKSTDMINNGSKYLTLPLAIKQKLKQYPVECPICVEEFTSSTLRNDHFEEMHLNSERGCQFCPIKCSCEELVDDHMKKFHYDQFKYECFVCKDKFPSVSHVVTHVKKLHPAHDPKNKQQSAVKSFSQQNLRTTQIAKAQRNESQDQGYFCDICNLTFPKIQFLRRHEQSQQHCDTLMKNLESLSTLPSSSTPVLPKRVSTPENITCSECYEEFSTLKAFVPHRLGHFGKKEKYMEINEENIYTCEICGDVSDSHSKVQIHLFWHLQNESSSKEKISNISKNNLSMSGKSTSQHVAKKSFGKQTRETHQEVVIGGVKRHLFTCESCNIGFTDQTHYNLHVRKFCRMKHSPLSNKSVPVVAPPKSTPKSAFLPSNFNKPIESEIQIVEIALCNLCCTLFNKSIKNVHDEMCSKCKRSNLEPSSNIIGFKTSIKMRKAIAACLKCDLLFSSPSKFSEHMLSIHGLPEVKESFVDEENLINKEKEVIMNDFKESLMAEATETMVGELKETPMTEERETLVEEVKDTLMEKIKETPVAEVKENPVAEVNEVSVDENKETALIEVKEILTNEEGAVPMNEEGMVPMNEEGAVPMNEEGAVPMNEEGAVPMNEEGAVPMNEEGAVPMNEEGAVPMNEEGAVPINEEGALPMNEDCEIPVHEENEIPITDENTLVLGGDFVIHCTTCNFIFFSTDTLSEHEKTCTTFSYSNSRLENYTPEFKAALEENCIIASCLHCDVAFNNPQDLTEHLELHQKSAASEEQDVMILDETSEKVDTSETTCENASIPVSQDTSSNILPSAQSNNSSSSALPTASPIKKTDDIESLRKNFSKLLSILVSDPDLMQQLGYGELLVDEVLVNVLQTMEQTPVIRDEKTTELDCLRKNIQILLDFCLEDQIMALIGDGKASTDDVVVEALKIFDGESSMSIVALE